jgi:dCMP deaminase
MPSESRILEFHNVYMNIAAEISKLSRCKRAKVGAVIVKDGNIISFGYNGSISGFPNECECNDVTLDTVIHAELNAILKCSTSVKDADIYITLSPCKDCAKMIKQAGIRHVYFRELYRDTTPLEKFQLSWTKI